MANGCNILPSLGTREENCCDKHDHEYQKGEFIAKILADFALMFCMIRANWLLTPVAVIAFVLCMTFGWVWWLKYLARRLFGWFPKKN